MLDTWDGTYFVAPVIIFRSCCGGFHCVDILLQSVELMEKTGIPGENHQPAVSHWQTLSDNVVSSTPRQF
jgi:hypothetical protein